MQLQRSDAVVNVAISDNSASNGGGIYNYSTLSVTNSTIASNTGSGIYLYGSYSPSGSSITIINNSIVANNSYSYSRHADERHRISEACHSNGL